MNKEARGVTIIPIARYMVKDGDEYPVEHPIEIWGKDLSSAKWMARHIGCKFVDIGILQSREVWHNPWEFLPSYN